MEKSLESHLRNAVESGKADDLLARLEKTSENPHDLQTVTDLLIAVDASKPMTAFRNFWQGGEGREGLPPLAKWSIMKTVRAQLSGSVALDTMVKFGFINYDAHLDENGQVNEEKVRKMGGMNKYLLKYGVKFGKYFVPELAAIEPYVAPLLKLQEIGGTILDKTRPAMREARRLREAPARTIDQIAKTEHAQILTTLPTQAAPQ